MHFPAADSWAFQKYPKSFILSKDKLHELLCSFIWCEVGSFAYRSANWNSWSLNPFLLLLMIQPLSLSPLPGGHVSRTRCWLPGHIPGWLEQRYVEREAAQPCYPREEAAGSGKAAAIPPSPRARRPWARLLQNRASTSPGVSEIFPVSAVFLSLSLITVGIIKHSNFRIWKDRAKSKFSYMSSSLFTPLFCIRWVRLNSSYQFTIS